MFDFLVELVTGSPWVYPFGLAVIVFDAVVPVLPSETLLITGGVLAARGQISPAGLMAVGFAGAVIGDNITYTLGWGYGARARDRLFRSEKARSRLEKAKELLDERPWLVAVARFVPGGRTAMTFAAGTLAMPRRRFLVYIIPGGLAWSVFVSLLGYVGGPVFQGSFWLPLAASLGFAAVLAAGAEALRRARARRA
ncbi:MAG TPA: DedA family protein [Solirubrobacteraceae bacterium]|nr:DedA family protein [Solirubrobacteraceae bacterium]